ncbi:hypothetical protein [Micromonospora inaquosa]|uniref:hypothetical protein n=1 Tax=Micromonospora inaquosa TaxID=2203716 RepID=UPI000F5EF545|nr:hypothetical protein [Micromonospora inaquosa]
MADATEITAIFYFENLGRRQAATSYQLFPTRVVAVRRLPDRPPLIEMGAVAGAGRRQGFPRSPAAPA